ncbi:hypothetical protein MATL_G00003060 [Megalops atlanticus]|uniref:HAT C-terminal dimerisation domain-containing protein n=1 Tax=Megalops atlanticus TaxID=7932 RepID=A0A9D3TDT8_MEGAT|nr:hypothetical protein MATL_G00003060 [Megalops atlanticus]
MSRYQRRRSPQENIAACSSRPDDISSSHVDIHSTQAWTHDVAPHQTQKMPRVKSEGNSAPGGHQPNRKFHGNQSLQQNITACSSTPVGNTSSTKGQPHAETPDKKTKLTRVNSEDNTAPSGQSMKRYSRNKSLQQNVASCSSVPGDEASGVIPNPNPFITMIVTDLLPLSIIEGIGFRKFMRGMNPGCSIPSGMPSLRSELVQLHEQAKLKVKASLDDVSDIVLTLESWTRAPDPYLTVRCHYIDRNWELKSHVLESTEFSAQQTGDDFVDQLIRISKEWNIKEKINFVVTDRSNISHSLESAGWKHIPCFANILDQVVTDALKGDPAFETLHKKCNDIVRFLHCNTKATSRLRQFPAPLKLPQLQLLKNLDSKWNSTFCMLQTLLQNQEAINSALLHIGKGTLCLNECEMPKIRNAVSALQPFSNATSEMSVESFTSVSNIIPLMRLLPQQIQDLAQKEENTFANLLKKHCAKRSVDIEDNYRLAASTFLDARFKNVLPKNIVEMHKDRLIKDMQNLGLTCQSNAKAPASMDDHPRSVWAPLVRQTKCEEELCRYAAEKTIPLNENPLTWWRSNKERFPHLHRVARKYLGIVSTSVPPAQAFSKAGKVLSLRRSHLEPENVDMMLFLNSYYGCFPKL